MSWSRPRVIGAAAYARLAELCDARIKSGLVAVHPATVAAQAAAAAAPAAAVRKRGGREPAAPPNS